jgi:hypothetical protein
MGTQDMLANLKLQPFHRSRLNLGDATCGFGKGTMCDAIKRAITGYELLYESRCSTSGKDSEVAKRIQVLCLYVNYVDMFRLSRILFDTAVPVLPHVAFFFKQQIQSHRAGNRHLSRPQLNNRRH